MESFFFASFLAIGINGALIGQDADRLWRIKASLASVTGAVAVGWSISRRIRHYQTDSMFDNV